MMKKIIAFLLFAILLLSALYAREVNNKNKKAEQIDETVYEVISEARKSFVAFQTTGDERSFERGVSGIYTLYRLYPLVSDYNYNTYVVLHKMTLHLLELLGIIIQQ